MNTRSDTMKQKTFMMLKPDAFTSHHAEEVIQDLKAHGLQIEKQAKITVTMEVMKTLLDHYEGVIDSMEKTFDFPGKLFNSFYYDGPHYILPMMITYEGNQDIIEYTRALVGKTNPKDAGEDTIRGKYSQDDYEQATKQWRLVNNVIHASDSHDSAQRELVIWQKYFE